MAGYSLTERFSAYSRLMRLDKPIGTLLLLWPTLWALWLAVLSIPPTKVLIVFILGVVSMRAAGCVINDFADRHIDGHVARTRTRPLPGGQVSEREAKGLFLVLVIISFALVLTMNTMTILLSFIALALAATYPFMKRYTHLPQVVLGAAFGWSIPMAWAAVSETVPLVCWVLFLANLCWTVAYDTQYAMVDREDDLKIGVKSTAILFGRYDKLIIGGLHLTTLVLLAFTGQHLNLGSIFYAGLLLAGALFAYQQYLITHRQREQCFKAFLNNHYAGMFIFIGIALSSAPFAG